MWKISVQHNNMEKLLKNRVKLFKLGFKLQIAEEPCLWIAEINKIDGACLL